MKKRVINLILMIFLVSFTSAINNSTLIIFPENYSSEWNETLFNNHTGNQKQIIYYNFSLFNETYFIEDNLTIWFNKNDYVFNDSNSIDIVLNQNNSLNQTSQIINYSNISYYKFLLPNYDNISLVYVIDVRDQDGKIEFHHYNGFPFRDMFYINCTEIFFAFNGSTFQPYLSSIESKAVITLESSKERSGGGKAKNNSTSPFIQKASHNDSLNIELTSRLKSYEERIVIYEQQIKELNQEIVTLKAQNNSTQSRVIEQKDNRVLYFYFVMCVFVIWLMYVFVIWLIKRRDRDDLVRV